MYKSNIRSVQMRKNVITVNDKYLRILCKFLSINIRHIFHTQLVSHDYLRSDIHSYFNFG